MRLVNMDTGEVLADQVIKAHTFISRLKGLMFTNELPDGACLHLKPCRSIHTLFMKYAIDVLHLDASHRIVGIQPSIKPGRAGTIFPDTKSVVELRAGTISPTTKIGQTVQFN